MKKLDQCLLKNVYAGYWKALPAVSDSLGSVFEQCPKKVFHYEAFCDDTQELSDICKVDAIALKRNNTSTCVSLLEFKGGKTTEDWNKEALVLKAVDTVLCGFPKFVDFDRSAWGSIFCDQDLALDYYIIISDEHVISIAEDGQKLLKDRITQQKGKEQKRQLKNKLFRYGNKHPFDHVNIVNVSTFLKRVGEIVEEEVLVGNG
jgi:hypothetical protein